MKRFRLLSVAAAVLAAAFALPTLAAAQAQEPPANARHGKRQPPSPQQVVDRMGQKLNLSDDQKTQLLPIITERQQKMQDLRAQASENRRQKRQEMKSIRDDSDKKIEAVLTDQQRKQYADMKQEMRDRAKQRRGHRGSSN